MPSASATASAAGYLLRAPWNLCTITMFRSERRWPGAARSCVRTVDDVDLAADQCRRVAELLFQIGAVVDQQILKSFRSSQARSMRTTKTIVSDLPEPCVCQTTPERSCGVSACAQPVDDLAGGAVLLIAADHLDAACRRRRP